MASCPAWIPATSHADQDRAAHVPTRRTRALSPIALAPRGPASAAARVSAPSAVSRMAFAQALSSGARCPGPWASAPSSRYARPISSHSSASVESRAARSRRAATESGGPPRPTPLGTGACNSTARVSALKRNVPMLFRRIPIAFGGERPQGLDEPWSRVTRIDDVVHVAARRREVGVRELLPILGLAFLGGFVLVEDFDRALRAHDGDLRRRPGHVVVPADVFRVHHVIRPAV